MTDDFGSAADTAIEHAGADAAASLAQAKGPPASPDCLNCGMRLSGEFCHHCGQSAQSLRRPFWTLVSESLETFFSLDGRIAHTLPNLMLRPGRMTRNYLDGQRARFIPPFRLYVFASLIFFVLLPLMTGQGLGFGPRASGNLQDARAQVEQAFADGNMSEEEFREAIAGLDQAEALWRGGIPGLIPDPPKAPGEDGEEAPPPPESSETEWAGFMPKEALDAIREAGERGDRDAAQFAEVMDDPARLARQTQEWIPRLMFVLLPVYALLLAAVYIWRRQFLFFDHLIVSLHFHSALFFAMSVGFLVSLLIGSGWVILAILIWSNWYLYRMLREVYGTGRSTAVLRVLTLDSIYFCVLLSGLLTAVILGALSL
jgi:hypothetical protein